MSDLTNPADIRPDHLEIVQNILREHLPAGFKVWVFGSRANWTTKDSSDLDLAVEGTGTLDHKAMVRLEVAFEESDLPYTVDVVDLNAVSPDFREIVEGQGVLLPVAKDPKCINKQWREDTFAQVLAEPVRNGVYKKKEFHGSGVKIVNMGELFAYPRLRDVEMRRVQLSDSEQQRFDVQAGDLLFARRSLVAEGAGKCSVVLEVNEPTGFESSIIRGRPDPTKVDSLFLYYYFNSPHGLHTLDTIRRQVAVAGITGKDLAHLTIPVPPLPEQQRIAHTLGTLDDKIELNRRMNRTLEEMARAIFQDWFVDFGPVRAKLEGREPYLPPGLWELFPDRLVDSELGEVPDGWEVKALGDCFNLTMGQSPPGSTYNQHGVGLPFFQGSTDFGARFPESRKYCTAPIRIAEGGDALVSVRAPVGALNMAWEKCCIGRGVAALRHRSGSSAYTYYSGQAMQPELQQYEQTGTVFGAITRKQFETLPVVSPAERLIIGFEAFIVPLEQRLRSNVADSRALAALRDVLLPKLVSGEVRVGNAENQVETIV